MALYGDAQKRDASITFDTFRALEKVQEIHSNCKILMQAGLQTLALDTMEQMTLHQEGKYLSTFNVLLSNFPF